MKVIDLSIGFSKGIIPPKIKYKGIVYEYSKTLKEYIKYDNCENFNLCYKTLQINVEQFNDEVEIIEDTPKEDKKIEKLGAFNIKKFYDDYPETAHFILEMFKKQEELIDKVNGE